MAILTVTNGTVTFTCDSVVAAPEGISSLLAETNIPGAEGGDVQYLGSPPKRFTAQGILKGSGAKVDLDKLRSLREGGVACTVTLAAFAQTWLQGSYVVASLSWLLLPGSVNVVGGAVLQFTVEFVSV